MTVLRLYCNIERTRNTLRVGNTTHYSVLRLHPGDALETQYGPLSAVTHACFFAALDLALRGLALASGARRRAARPWMTPCSQSQEPRTMTQHMAAQA